MVLICVDPGTYSLKYMVINQEKKSHQLIDSGVITLSDHIKSDEEDIFSLHSRIVQELKDTYSKNAKICTTILPSMVTSRFLNLPVKNKKKAELMIPFQLEEDLPFSFSDIHLAIDYTPQGDQMNAAVSIVKKDEFENFYNAYEDKGISLSYLTSPMSLYAEMAKQPKLDQNFCIIDFGHTTTKVYFFKNKQLVSQHISYISGKTLTDAISKSYQIEESEAIKYKHNNAFVLTEEQLAEVNDSQRKFATLMDEVLSALVSDLKRWDLGYRVTHQISPQIIYITGGSSKIKNIESYLLDRLSYPIAHLDQEAELDQLDKAQGFSPVCSLLRQSFSKRNKISSFLTGDYTQKNSEDLPLHSISFIGLRVMLACLLSVIIIFSERYYINKSIKSYRSKTTTLLKNSVLEMTPLQRRQVKKSPEKVLKSLQARRQDMISQKKALATIQNIDSFSALVELSQVAVRQGVILSQYKSNSENEIVATFESSANSTLSDMENFQKRIESQGWPELKTSLNKRSKKLTIRYFGSSSQ